MEQHPAYDSCFSSPSGSAPSSPGRAACFYYSAPASPTHFAISSAACRPRPCASGGGSASFEFDFPTAESMTTSADELFCNGQIRPMKLSAHLQFLAPLTESDAEEGLETFARGRELKPRAGSLRGRTRSLSPLRTTPPPSENNEKTLPGCDGPPPPCGSRSSSRRWVFLKEFLYRSKSERGNNERQNGKLRGSPSFSPAKDRKKTTRQSNAVGSKEDKGGKRKGRSAHEVHYTAKRAQAEEMRKKTFLPYRQGLLGCLGFSASMADGASQFNVASMVEDVLQQHGKRLNDLDLASRKAQEASLRRYDAAGWLRKMAGVVAAKDLPAEPSEEDLRLGLRSGIILCNVLNKVQPGAVPKVVEAPPDNVIILDGAALTAYQYFENVRNSLVAIEEMGIPTFEASDLEQGGKSCRIVNSVLALKSYSEWKQCGRNGQWKFSGNSRPPAVGKPAMRKNSDLFLNFISRISDKPVDGGPGEDETFETGSLGVLVRELLSDKNREDIPLIVEDLLSKVMEEIERKMSTQNEQIQMAPQVVKDVQGSARTSFKVKAVPGPVPSFNGTDEIEFEKDAKIMPDEKFSTDITKDHRCPGNIMSEDHSARYLESIERQERSVQELKNLLRATKRDMQLLRTKYRDEVDNLGKHLTTLAHAADGYKKVLEENRKLYNQVQDLKGNIRVYCRVRPFLPGQANGSCAVEDINDGSLTIVTPSKTGKTKKTFTFNKCFGPCSSQEEVFADTQPLIRSVLDGYNVCIFAYGQTGSGKTFTMTGPKELTKETLGVNYRALSDLFQISEERKDVISYEISVQMMEIYNEQVRDLLATDGRAKKLEIRNNCSNGINVPSANLVPVTSTSDVINLMNLGHKNRAVGSTLMNDRSSRSHSCLTVHVQGQDLTSGAILCGCMHLVDLAGSERLDKTEAIGDRLKEAQHINRSLSALGDVISSLALKQSHVPYRNSKLTQLLQDSLGGKAKTLMFVHISPEPDALGETISTLKFAERVSTVELGAAKANKESTDVKELKEQIANLKVALARKEEGESRAGQHHSRNSSPDRRGMKSAGSSPSHFSWDGVDDTSKTEEQTNSSSTSRRHSLDPQDLLANSPGWPPLSSSPDEKGDIFYLKSGRPGRAEKTGEKGPASRRHSLDNGIGRGTHEFESAAVEYMDDIEIGTSDSSEADYQIQLNTRKCSSGGPSVEGSKARKPSQRPAKGSPEVRSQIPQPARRMSNGVQASLQKGGKKPVFGVGKRKPATGK